MYVYGVALLFKIEGKEEVRSIMFSTDSKHTSHTAKDRAMIELKVSGEFSTEFNESNLVCWSESYCTLN